MRLLIADDEDYTREGIMESIHWESLGITEIEQARDGKEALEVSRWFKPDIVLTDVKMPKLNGIEFAEKLIAQCPNSKLIFMSGYLEIEYLKSAIKLSAIDYIEKPIYLESVENSVRKAIDLIDEKKKQSISNAEKKELQMQKLANMLQNRNKDKELIYHISEEIGYPVNGDYVAVLIWDKEGNVSEEENVKKINAFWKQNNNYSICSYIKDDQYFVILKLKERNLKKIYLLCEWLAEIEKGYCIGIGYDVDNLFEVSESYEAAMFNVSRSFYNLKKRVFAMDNKTADFRSFDPRFFEEFNSIMKNTPKKLYQWTQQLMEDICEAECYEKEQVKSLFVTFAKLIIDDKKRVITRLENIYCKDDIEHFIEGTKSIFQLKDFILNLIDEYQKEVEESNKYSKLVRDVIDYIHSHYAEVDLGIEDIAKCMHFSAAYLSVLFKQETGITIKQFISDFRLQISKKLLSNEHYKITEIAELCGYSNANYFAKVFKAATDLSPVEYRKRNEVV